MSKFIKNLFPNLYWSIANEAIHDLFKHEKETQELEKTYSNMTHGFYIYKEDENEFDVIVKFQSRKDVI